MATFAAVNVLTNAVEGVKYNATGNTSEIWSAAVTTSLASGDTITGPSLPAGCYLVDVVVDTDDLDSATSITFKAGYSGALAAWIADGNTTMRTGGIVHANVAGTVGYTSTSDKQLLVTITATAGTPVAGTVRLGLIYTASP